MLQINYRTSVTMIRMLLLMLMISQAVEQTVCGKPLSLGDCTGGLRSCAKRSSKSFTRHDIDQTVPCSCDPQCRFAFDDCCGDFETFSAEESLPEDTTHNNFSWSCRNVFPDPKVTKLVYIVDKCMDGWPKDEISKNCSTRNASSFHDILLAVPVTNKDEVLFRNAYCAYCNGIRYFNPWNVSIVLKTALNHSSGLQYEPFLVDKKAKLSDIRLSENKMGVRICLDTVNTCEFTHDKILLKECEKGPAALITDDERDFKNYACLACNYPNTSIIPSRLRCGLPSPKNNGKPWPATATINTVGNKYSLIFGQGFYSSFVTERQCPEGYLFHEKNRHCLKTYQFPQLRSLQALRAYYITLEYKDINASGCCKARNISRERNEFFDLFERILHNKTDDTAHVSSFKIISDENSSFAALRVIHAIREDVANNSANNNTTQPRTSKLDDITMEFSTSFLTDACTYIPHRVMSREMVCIENRTFPFDAQRVEDRTTVYVKEMQKNYSRGEFFVFERENGTVIVVCERFVPMYCPYSINTTKETDWILLRNLSLYYKITGENVVYGDYWIKNNTVSICLSEKSLRSQPTKTVEIHSIHDDILFYLSHIAIVISISSLVALLTIYSIFPALRNLPGKNLMLLSSIIAIAQLLWLLQGQILSLFSSRCDVILIALHYFFIASFTSSGSIAYHSFKTFHSISQGKLPGNGGKFLWYSSYSLGCPALTVALFWFIDFHNVFKIGYGKTANLCWFQRGLPLYVAFYGPLFSQLLFNTVLLFMTMKWIYKCSKEKLALNERGGGVRKQDIGIYLRMSSLMGLTWILGALLELFPDLLVFDYLFNVVSSLQGLYIAMAFLLTTRVRKLLGFGAETERSTATTGTIQVRL